MPPRPSASAPDQLYVRAMEATRRVVDNVREDQWRAPTPCTEWTVRDIANHLVSENLWSVELFAGKRIEEVGSRFDGDLVGSDPKVAYVRSTLAPRSAVEAACGMGVICHLSAGDEPGAEYARQLFMDTLIHGWDIAQATGQDARLPTDLVAACLPIAQRLMNEWGGSQWFAAPVPTAPHADAQTRLLALAGRRA